MSKSEATSNKISGFRITVMIVSLLFLSFVMAFCMLLGVSSFKQNAPVVIGEDATTVRKALPSSGALPSTAKPLDNIGYMAYVLDNQPSYHVYAYNSTKSTGYEQITQSWKDYKDAAHSGANVSVMVGTDLSYSALVKSSSQSCFIGGNEAHIRSGKKPASVDSKPTDVEWATGAPSVYDKNGYKYAYGEFSTEISVYVINEDTLSGADDVIDNGDGTYSQTYYLNENAACWYQYGMKTRGGLKTYPKFKKIEITFTFDGDWQVLKSVCNEKTTINPRALGGMDMDSNSVTTTKYDYNFDDFDNTHFSYFNDYFKRYQGTTPGKVEAVAEEVGVLDILGGGFSKVVGGGQQFKLSLTVGKTEYDGKIFLSLPDMGDPLGTLDARVELCKKGSDRQALYIEFAQGAINVYYGADFALTANVKETAAAVEKIVGRIKDLSGAPQALADEGGKSGFDMGALVNDLSLKLTETEAVISLQSDDLFGSGLGVDVAIGFDRIREEDGDSYSVKSLSLNYIKYDGTTVALKAFISPDDGKPIERDAASAPANLADYANSVYDILNSNTVRLDFNLTDKSIAGLTLNASAYLALGSGVAANAEIDVVYRGISLKLSASYVYEREGYGKLYLRVTEIAGKTTDAKIYCDVADTADSVKGLIALFGGGVSATAEEDVGGLADIINKVLNLNFSKIIGKVYGDKDEISVEINVDELLNGLDLSSGLKLGVATLAFDNARKAFSCELSEIGCGVVLSGSDRLLPAIENKGDYVDVNAYVKSLSSLLGKPSYNLSISFEGGKLSDKADLSGLRVNGEAIVAIESGSVRVALPLRASYREYAISLTAYYTINSADKNYGTAYLHIGEVTVGGRTIALDAKAYCDIKRAADGIKRLFGRFSASAQSEESETLASVIELLLKLDYNEIVNATNEKLTVKLDVDEILSHFDISLGGVSLGELSLEFDVEKGVLSGALEKVGLAVSVKGNDAALPPFETEGYVDANTYIDGISAFLGKRSYTLGLSFAGNGDMSKDVDLTGLLLEARARFAFAEGYTGLTVSVDDLKVKYGELSISLSARYELSFNGGFGTAHVRVCEVNGKDVDARVLLDITRAADGVKNIVRAFSAQNAVADEKGEGADVLSKLVKGVLSLDYGKLLNATDERAEINLDLDALLSEFALGLRLGTVNLAYIPEKCEFVGSDREIGLESLKIVGVDQEIEGFVSDGYIDLNAFIDGVQALVSSGVYEIAININGGEGAGAALNGLNVDATAYATVKNGCEVAVYLPVKISYRDFEISLNAYYSIELQSGNFGTVYLEIVKIDGTALDIKIYCDIEETVAAVKEIINSFAPVAAAEGDRANLLSRVLDLLLRLDYAEIIGGTREKLSVTINADEVLSALEIDFAGIRFGELRLELALDDGAAKLIGRLDGLGLNFSVRGNENYAMPSAPAKDDYFDVATAIRLVNRAIEQGKAIAAAKGVAFELGGVERICGILTEISGYGEALWGDSLKFAVSLSLTVDGEKIEVNLIYDRDGEKPVILAVNGTGVAISRGEIDTLVNSFKNLISVLSGNAENDGAAAVSAYAETGDALGEALTNANVRKALGALLGFANELVVKLEAAPDNVYNLVIEHVKGATLSVGADEGLSLEFRKGETRLYANARVGDGKIIRSVLAAANNEKVEYLELSAFVKKLYDGLLDRFENLSLKNILGDGPYSVNVSLIGTNGGISELEGLKLVAKLYYDEGVAGTLLGTKLMHVALDMDINGTAVKAVAAYCGRTLYLELNRVGGAEFTGVKFKADADDVFYACERLVRLITDTDLVGFIQRFTGKSVSRSDAENLALFAAQADGNGGAPALLTKLLGALLSLDPEQAFSYDKEAKTVSVNVDPVLEALSGLSIGTITANQKDKSLSANVALEGRNPWLSLEAAPCKRITTMVNPDDYTDISFLSTLLADLSKTVADENGRLYDKYTFAGSIVVNLDVPVLGNIVVEFRNATLTAGFDGNGSFYVSFAAQLQETKALFGVTVAQRKDISVTYCDGLIVLGRELHTSTEKYKVLTAEYFLDNMLSKNNSPLRWLLGTSDSAWSTIMGAVNANIDSGLTKPKVYTLYGQLQQAVKENNFKLSDYITGMCVRAGAASSRYGNGAELVESTFSLADDINHYAFDINAEALTGGLFKALCAVITRNDDGISGIKAYGEMSTVVRFTVNFDKYLRGEEALFGDEGAGALGSVAARNYLAYVTEVYGFEKGYDRFDKTNAHTNPIFGCFTAENSYDGNGNLQLYKEYSSSDVLESISLDIYADENALSPERTLEVLYGSTVKLVSDFPEFADGCADAKLVYFVRDGNTKLANTIVIGERLSSTVLENEQYEVVGISYGADGKGRVSIYKAKETALKVVFNFVNIAGMKPVSAALADGEELVEYEQGGFTFLGWYKEPTFETLITRVNAADVSDGAITLYGKYVKSVYKAANGVIYEFVSAAGDVPDHYAVIGLGASSDYVDYTRADAWLILENSIFGYPVTEIRSNAFFATSIKNVVVPDNIVKAGALAFGGNADMRTAVFLAESVFFEGSCEKDMFNRPQSANYPFMGCYSSVDNNKTLLKLYFKGIYDGDGASKGGNPYWSAFYFAGTDKPRFIGNDGGERADGDWLFASFDENDFGFETGIYAPAEITYEKIADRAVPVLNGESYTDGFIYGYVITVTENVCGGIRRVTITASDDSANGWHLLSFDETQYEIKDAEGLDDGVTRYNELYFVRPETNVEIFLKDKSKAFTGIALYGDASMSESSKTYSAQLEYANKAAFKMGNGAVYADFTAETSGITSIKLKSNIEFLLDGAATESYAIPAGKESADVYLADLSALTVSKDGGFTLIGWAYEDGATLAFEQTITHREYYAVWARSRAEITAISVDDRGVRASSAGSIYGWYTDVNFAGNAVALCSDNAAIIPLTTETTVLYPRMQYSLTVSMTGANTVFGYTEKIGGGAADVTNPATYNDVQTGQKNDIDGAVLGKIKLGSKETTEYFNLTLVPEGCGIKVYRFWGDALVVTVTDGDYTVATYLIKGRKSNTGAFSGGSWRTLGVNSPLRFIGGGWTATDGESEVSVENRDLYVPFNGNDEKQQYEFGHITRVTQNAEVNVRI